MKSNIDLAGELTNEAVACLRYGMEKIEHCLSQLGSGQIWWRPNDHMNSIGNLLLHLAGNLSQWIVSGVGDVPDTRDRPAEFSERRTIQKDELLRKLIGVVDRSCLTLNSVTAGELLVRKRVQGNDVTKLHAMMHSVTHFQGHVQEIIGMTRQQLGDTYRYHWQPSTAEEGAPDERSSH